MDLREPDPYTLPFRQGEGTPLVLLHGLTMSWRAWLPVLPFLVGRHEVIVPTLSGHRGGPRIDPDWPLAMDALVDVVEAQLDEVGVRTAHLAGNSLGGWVALELARRGRARSVVGLSPAGTWKARRDLIRLMWLFRIGHLALCDSPLSVLSRIEMFRNIGLRRTMAHPERVPAEELNEMLADGAQCQLVSAMLAGRAEVEPMREFDVALCPVHIAWCARDKLIPYRRYGKPMQDVVRGAQFSVLPGVGHMPMYDDPRLVARTILEMTTSVDASCAVDEARSA
jgi:pimeloyl-ACP methyl ester carboxylesterase